MAATTDFFILIESSGTEKDFMTLVLAAIQSVNPAIVCDGSIDQYDSSEDIAPTFDFYLNSKHLFTLTRRTTLSNKSTGMRMTVYAPQTVPISIILPFTGDKDSNAGQDASASYYRQAWISWIVNENFSFISWYK